MTLARLKTSEYNVFGSSFQTIVVNWDNVEYITELFEARKDKTKKQVGTTIHFSSGQMISVSTVFRNVKHDMLWGKG
tara:strand:- start:581 stop:811 length:231 start_codon:yes stop_codon:yes gene_type:complete